MKKYLRNTLKEGIIDTFETMMGTHGYSIYHGGQAPKLTYGLTDIFLFPLLSRALIHYGFPMTPSSRHPELRVIDLEKDSHLRNVVGLFGLLFQPFRFAIATGLTLLALPIVFAVHTIKFPFVKYYENKFLALKSDRHDKDSTLKVYMKTTKATLNQLEIKQNSHDCELTIKAKTKENSYSQKPLVKDSEYCRLFRSDSGYDDEQSDAINAGLTLGLYEPY